MAFAIDPTTRPWYCDTFWSHFRGRGFDATEGLTNTTLNGAVSQDATSLTLVDATGFVVGESIVVGSGTNWQSFTVDAVAGNVLTVYPKVRTGGFNSGSVVNHAFGNDSHPVYTLSYAAFAQTLSDTKQRRALLGVNRIDGAGDFATTYTDARGVANVPTGWESLSTVTCTAVSYATTDRLPFARSGGGTKLNAGAIGGGLRTLASISVTAGEQLVVLAMAKHTSGAGFTVQVVDKANPTTVLGSLPAVFGDRSNFNHFSMAQVAVPFAVPVGVTSVEIRVISTGGTDECYIDDVRLLTDRQTAAADRFLFEDPGSRTVAWIGDSWGVGAAGAAEQFRTALQTRLGKTVNWLNAAVSGNTLADMNARFAADIAPSAPLYLIVQYGANDLSQGRTAAQMQVDAENMVAQCRAIGTIPVFACIAPMASTLAAAASDNEAVRTRLSSLQSEPVAPMSNFRQLALGAVIPLAGTGNTLNSYKFANTTDTIEWVFQVPDPGDGTRQVTITKLGYQLTSVQGTAPVFSISLQGVNASGNPDGTIKSAAGATANFTPAGTNTYNWVTLGSSYTANVGEWLSIVIAYVSGTFNTTTNDATFGVTLGSNAIGVPYEIQNIAGVRTRSASQPLYGFQSASKSFGMPVMTISSVQFSTAAQRAMRFLLDPTYVRSYKVGGARLNLTQPAAGKVIVVSLYLGTTVLQTVTVPASVEGSAGNVRTTNVWFDTTNPLVTLFGGQEYRLSVEPQDASNNVALSQFDFSTAADMDAIPGGQNWYLSTRASGGATAWTDVVTSRPQAELIISDWSAPASGIVFPI